MKNWARCFGTYKVLGLVLGSELGHWSYPHVPFSHYLSFWLPRIHGRLDFDRVGPLHRHGHRLE